jgi:hypothetical protein
LSRPARGARKPARPELSPPDASDVEKLRRYHAELGAFLAGIDANASVFEKVSRHVRRHLPLYALAAVFGLIVVLVPTRNGGNGGPSTAGSLTGSDTGQAADGGTASAGATEAAGTANGGKGPVAIGGAPGSLGGTSVGSGGAPVARVQVGSGTTVGGFACRPGVRQIPWSTYAVGCVGKFTGNNGGATYNGVTAKTIKVEIRHWAVDQGDATDAQNAAQGRATRAQAIALLNTWSSWFGKVMDLYGRKLVFEDYQSKVSNAVQEAESQGEEGACADATDIAQTAHAFADLGYATSFIETQPFADCATQQKLFVPFGASYFPESFYRDWNPYVWHVYTECERIGHDSAEYEGKRLWNRDAKWAKDPVYQKEKRVFGLYVPNNPGYQRCVNLSAQDLKNKYGGTVKSRFDYTLDISRFPDQAAEAVLQFKRDGVTTLINACDTLSTRFLSEAADKQQWGPEWLLIGVALQDTDGAARTWNQNVVDGHTFGMSQLGKLAQIEGKQGEAYRSWRAAFGNTAPPVGYGDAYYRILAMYDMFQAAGPVLTPANIARGLRAMPVSGGSTGPFGTWSFRTSHTAIVDSREIYYVGSALGYDGSKGAYLETYGGRRFQSGQWPAEEPAVYPK